MSTYMDETEYAVRNLIELATTEEKELQEKLSNLHAFERVFHGERWNFQTSDLHDDFTPAYVMAAFGRMASAHDSMKQARTEISVLEEAVAGHEVSVQSICGSILQIAKQGMSMVHGPRSNAPEGRGIGSLPLRDIVWQGRNQTIHYEANTFADPVIRCFAVLETEQGEQFSLTKYNGQNRARQVIDLLEWTTYQGYEADMNSLLS